MREAKGRARAQCLARRERSEWKSGQLSGGGSCALRREEKQESEYGGGRTERLQWMRLAHRPAIHYVSRTTDSSAS